MKIWASFEPLTLLLTLGFLLGSVFLSSQNTPLAYMRVYEAEALYRNQQLSDAVQKYREAFQDTLPCVSCILDAIHCTAALQDEKGLSYFLERGLGMGLTITDYRRIWPNLPTDIHLNKVLSIVDTITPCRLYQSRLNPALIASLKQMAERDQKYRSSDLINETLMRQNDSINWQELSSLIAHLGRLPHYSEIGMEGSDHLSLLIHHMDLNQIRWLIPLLVEAMQKKENFMGHEILYQLDRIGMGEGEVYTISPEFKIVPLCRRTLMKNNLFCQAYGEWFEEKGSDQQIYHTPLDPCISAEEIERLRKLVCLDGLANKRQRTPWAKTVDIKTFENVVNY